MCKSVDLVSTLGGLNVGMVVKAPIVTNHKHKQWRARVMLCTHGLIKLLSGVFSCVKSLSVFSVQISETGSSKVTSAAVQGDGEKTLECKNRSSAELYKYSASFSISNLSFLALQCWIKTSGRLSSQRSVTVIEP